MFGDSSEFDKIQGIFSHFVSIVKDFKIRSQYIETDSLDRNIGSSMMIDDKEIKIVSNHFEKDLKLNDSVNVKKMNEIITNIQQYKWSPMISNNFVRFAFEPNYL
jgi:UTP-glucose-1-phosphate uridylyltransferase